MRNFPGTTWKQCLDLSVAFVTKDQEEFFKQENIIRPTILRNLHFVASLDKLKPLFSWTAHI